MNKGTFLTKYKDLIVLALCVSLVIVNLFIGIISRHPPQEFPRLNNTVASSLSNDLYYRAYWKIPHIKKGKELYFYYHIANYTDTTKTIRVSVFIDYQQQLCKIGGEWKKVHLYTIEPGEYKKIPITLKCEIPGEHELFVWSRLRSYEESPKSSSNLFYDNSSIAKTPKVKIIVKE